MSLRALHIWGPGINCQRELGLACERAGMQVEVRHIRELMAEPALIQSAHFLALPGGFTYGDAIAAGKLEAVQLRRTLLPELERFLAEGKLIFGVCNGFQTLAKAGLLPGAGYPVGAATLTWNDSGRFECRWVDLKVNRDCPGPWTRELPEVIEVPLAHAEGKFVTANLEILEQIEAANQVAFWYADPSGAPTLAYPANPSGSTHAIAGIVDPTGQILGMMPHPERHLFPTESPAWTRRGLRPELTLGALFASAAQYLRETCGARV